MGPIIKPAIWLTYGHKSKDSLPNTQIFGNGVYGLPRI